MRFNGINEENKELSVKLYEEHYYIWYCPRCGAKNKKQIEGFGKGIDGLQCLRMGCHMVINGHISLIEKPSKQRALL